ncbi:DUF835 domain-containing protein [Thermococcus sp.]|uniref:DUF835 domain-containing protein n=1 Tax=Thermococcus sp. TaxID=35749 RepID=UPI002613D41E|nr:DUF835 domain-containing protein [Thermococcus sp.]
MIEFAFGVALLVAYVLLFYRYHFTNRRSLAYYSLALFALAVPFFVRDASVYSASLAFSAAFLWLANIEAADELFKPLPNAREFRYLALVPLAGLIFLFPGHPTVTLFILVGSIAGAGFYLMFVKSNDLRRVGLTELIFSSTATVWGFLFSSVYAELSAALGAFLMAYVVLDVFMGASLFEDFEFTDSRLDVKTGLLMMSSVPEGVLDGALVFSRSRGDGPNRFWITKVSGERSVSPTNLARMLDMAVKFMARAEEKGVRPVVVIDGLEYLMLENGFIPVLKFLTTLRDYAHLHGGTVILVGDDSFLDGKERTLLKRLMG